MSRAVLTCCLALLLCPSPAHALRIRTNIKLLAWSTDGQSVLLQKDRDGPEGGGSISYLLLGNAFPRVLQATVSQDFSPGDGSTPQRVSAGSCRKALASLAAGLKRLKFVGVKVVPGRCNKKMRGLALELSAATRKLAEASVTGRGQRVIVDGRLDIWLEKGRVRMTTPARKARKTAQPGSLVVARGGSKKVLLILHQREYGDVLLDGLYRSAKGGPGGFKKVPLRWGKN